jgi:hypothetical protein
VALLCVRSVYRISHFTHVSYLEGHISHLKGRVGRRFHSVLASILCASYSVSTVKVGEQALDARRSSFVYFSCVLSCLDCDRSPSIHLTDSTSCALTSPSSSPHFNIQPLVLQSLVCPIKRFRELLLFAIFQTRLHPSSGTAIGMLLP